MAYAVSSVFLIALRKLPNRVLISIGVIVFVLSIGCSLVAQDVARHDQRVPGRCLDDGCGWGR